MHAQSACIGVVKCGNKQAAQEITSAECIADMRAAFTKTAGISGKQQRGKKQQFNMLPDGFVYGSEQSDKYVFPCPLIYKMGEGSGYGNKQNSGDDTFC